MDDVRACFNMFEETLLKSEHHTIGTARFSNARAMY